MVPTFLTNRTQSSFYMVRRGEGVHPPWNPNFHIWYEVETCWKLWAHQFRHVTIVYISDQNLFSENTRNQSDNFTNQFHLSIPWWNFELHTMPWSWKNGSAWFFPWETWSVNYKRHSENAVCACEDTLNFWLGSPRCS